MIVLVECEPFFIPTDAQVWNKTENSSSPVVRCPPTMTRLTISKRFPFFSSFLLFTHPPTHHLLRRPGASQFYFPLLKSSNDLVVEFIVGWTHLNNASACCSFFYSPVASDLLMMLCVPVCSTRQFLFQSNYFVYFLQQFRRVSGGCRKERATVHESSVTHTCEHLAGVHREFKWEVKSFSYYSISPQLIFLICWAEYFDKRFRPLALASQQLHHLSLSKSLSLLFSA